MTMASLGRSMNVAENMAQLLLAGDVRSTAVAIGRAGSDLHARLDALHAFQHDALAFGESLPRMPAVFRRGLPELDGAPFHVVVCVHHVHEIAALIREDRLARSAICSTGLRGLDDHGHEFTVRELAQARARDSPRLAELGSR